MVEISGTYFQASGDGSHGWAPSWEGLGYEMEIYTSVEIANWGNVNSFTRGAVEVLAHSGPTRFDILDPLARCSGTQLHNPRACPAAPCENPRLCAPACSFENRFLADV